MTDREKLIELLEEAIKERCLKIRCIDCNYHNSEPHPCRNELIVDHLISNGVTVRKWIPVTERLPEKSGKYLVCTNGGKVYQTKFYSYPEDKGSHWGQKDNGKSITHWMPLSEPPKEDKT